MRTGMMRFFTVANVLLAMGLVASALWLYGREHDTRRMEREIRDVRRATLLEQETIRRLQIEWQRLRNPMRLEPLARQLDLLPPDPTAVLPMARALSLLPLRPPETVEEEGASQQAQDALAGLAAQAAQSAQVAQPAEDDAMAGKAVRRDALGDLIRGIMPEGGRTP